MDLRPDFNNYMNLPFLLFPLNLSGRTEIRSKNNQYSSDFTCFFFMGLLSVFTHVAVLKNINAWRFNLGAYFVVEFFGFSNILIKND